MGRIKIGVLTIMGEKNKVDSTTVKASYPLSPMQRGMLYHHILAPNSGAYIIQIGYSLHEELDVEIFKEACNNVVARYDILKTGFRWEVLEEPVQDVYFNVILPFEIQDWQHFSPAIQQNKLEEFLKKDRIKGFNLHEPPLMRMTLFYIGQAKYWLVWSSHHIINSNRSNRLILEEIFSNYDAMRQGKQASLKQPKQYRDYINWLQEEDISKSEELWRNILDGVKNTTSIGSLRTGKHLDIQEREYKVAATILSETTSNSLKELAKQNQVTINTFVQGAWALLLSRYNGQEDIVFGEVRAHTHWGIKPEESAAGLFLNTLPLRIQVNPDKSLLTWLREIRQLQIQMREHERSSLVDIQRWSGVHRGTSLFDSIYVFDFQDLDTYMQSEAAQWRNTESRKIIVDIVDNEYPMTLYAVAESSLKLRIAFDGCQFGNDIVNTMLGQLKVLLENMAKNPDCTLSSISMQTEAERHQLLVEWNNTRVDYPQDKLIHQIFEAQAEKTPDAIAVVFEEKQLTYKELNERANKLAHYLRLKGVGPDSLVGIAVERSVEMVVGLFGILKAGGAYVPIDPTYPAERISYMIEDANAPVLLTQQRLLDRLPAHKAQVVCLDTDWEKYIFNQNAENPTCQINLDNLAYVIYTSGSTGKPKGAMNTHAGILNRLLWMQDTYRLTAQDVILQKTPFSFDVSVWEFFWPLMFGARLVVARPEGHKDSDYLVRAIMEHRITTIHFVPSMLQIFLMAKDVEQCTSLRQVICSGEALPLELQNRFFSKLNIKLHNLYGPTEAAVDVTYWECQRDTELQIVPIGRPVANTRMYILDRDMQPVPVGIAGELYIGGVQVGRGYWNRTELTDERFIPDPFSNKPEERLYRTGDSCRYLPDGNIEYLGRLDFQVKIRGNRIELGEIETLLGQHPAVREAVVLAREDIPGDVRLAAYITFNQGQNASAGDLRNYIKERLPDFMFPSYFIILEKFPLTPNQKIDRKALPAPDKDQLKPETKYLPPRSDLEKTIVKIWQDVLNISKVGLNDNFFDLGGHSLLIVRVYYRLQEVVDKPISITDMFRYPTIDSLVKYISMQNNDAEKSFARMSSERSAARRTAIIRRQQMKQNIRKNQ